MTAPMSVSVTESATSIRLKVDRARSRRRPAALRAGSCLAKCEANERIERRNLCEKRKKKKKEACERGDLSGTETLSKGFDTPSVLESPPPLSPLLLL
jgi:hypothetical protein